MFVDGPVHPFIILCVCSEKKTLIILSMAQFSLEFQIPFNVTPAATYKSDFLVIFLVYYTLKYMTRNALK